MSTFLTIYLTGSVVSIGWQLGRYFENKRTNFYKQGEEPTFGWLLWMLFLVGAFWPIWIVLCPIANAFDIEA